jgi:hypothetical protein
MTIQRSIGREWRETAGYAAGNEHHHWGEPSAPYVTTKLHRKRRKGFWASYNPCNAIATPCADTMCGPSWEPP